MIIGLTGKIGSGKTTLANYLTDRYRLTEYSFADPLKQICLCLGFSRQQLYGSQEEKLIPHPHWGVSGREMLQKLGTDIFRRHLKTVLPEMRIKRTIWADLFELKYQTSPGDYIVSDVRFVDEAEAIKELGGVIIRTVRRNDVSSEHGQEHLHPSETEMDRIRPDFVIDNDKLTIPQAQQAADKIMAGLNILTKIDQLRNRPNNWDEEDYDAPDSDVLITAKEIVKALADYDWPLISTDGSGGLNLRYISQRGALFRYRKGVWKYHDPDRTIILSAPIVDAARSIFDQYGLKPN